MAAGSSKHILTLIKKDLLLEIRQQYTFYGVLLYVASTIFVVYLTMGQPEETVWNALFWVIQLFVSVNAVAKSFLQDSKGRMLYYYTISGAGNYIIAKIIFNVLLMMIMSFLTLLVFILLLGDPVLYFLEFVLISFLG